MRHFDAHAHVSAWPDSVVRAMLEQGTSDLCNISYPRDGSSAEALRTYEQELFSEEDVQAVRVHRVFSLPFGIIQQSPDAFLETSLSKIEALKDQANVVGVKIWKDVGMELREPDGRPLTIDSALLEPIFSAIANTRLICIVHTGDPLIAWTQEARDNEYFRRNPRFSMFGRPEYPSFCELVERFEGVVERWRQIIFVGAHFVSLDHDFGGLAALLRRNPNLIVDSAGRHDAVLRKSGEDFRSLLDSFPERVIYGSDWTVGRLSTLSEIADSTRRRKLRLQQIIGILDESDLSERFFWKNAYQIFRGHHED